jgi:hypothetical protein
MRPGMPALLISCPSFIFDSALFEAKEPRFRPPRFRSVL